MEKVIVELEAKTGKAEASLQGVINAVNNLSKANKESQKETNKSISTLDSSSKSLAKGFKGVGLAMKAAGFSIIMKIVDSLGNVLMSNQKVVNAMSISFETVSVVLKKVSDVFVETFKSVSDATGGFDALQKVLSGALSIAVNTVSATIQTLILGVQKTQLAWEESFLGNGDPKEIKILNEAIQETQDKLTKTGQKILNAGKDISGNFLEALGEVGSLAEGVANATSKAIDEIDLKQAITDGKRLANSKKNFERLAQEQTRLVEKYDLQAEQQRQIRDDESKSIDERIRANNVLGEILLKQNEAEKKTVQSRINALKEEERLKGTSIELSNEIFELQTEMIAVDAKVAGFQSEQQTNINSLRKESLDLTNSQSESDLNLNTQKQKFAAEQIINEQLRLEKLIEINEAEKIIEQERLQAIIDLANGGTQAKIDAQIAFNEFTNTNEEENFTLKSDLFKKESELDRQKIRNKESVVDALSQFASAESGIGKALLIVKQGLALQETIMDLKRITFKGIEAVGQAGVDTASNVSSSSKIGFPQNLITIAGAIAQGVGVISSVKSAVSKTKASANISVPTPSIPTPSIASIPPAFNVVGQSDTNQLADAIGGQSKTPQRAYVVASDVTTGQEMDRNIVRSASI